MGLLNKEVTLLHFDDTYFAQKKLYANKTREIDLRDLQHVNLFCEKESLYCIDERINQQHPAGITFIGSGNYHYVTYLLLSRMEKPFTLVLFDNHPDTGYQDGQYHQLFSCGTWVYYALQHCPMLEQVVIIGPTNLKNDYYSSHRITIFPFSKDHRLSTKTILSTIHSQNVYISIDKDVLRPNVVTTNWDQGVMSMETLTHYLHTILVEKDVMGIDICGEMNSSPANAFHTGYEQKIVRNEKANLQILQSCLKYATSEIRGA